MQSRAGSFVPPGVTWSGFSLTGVIGSDQMHLWINRRRRFIELDGSHPGNPGFYLAGTTGKNRNVPCLCLLHAIVEGDMTTVFLAGHGRADYRAGRLVNVGNGVNVYFAVAEGYNSSGSYSKALVKGVCRSWMDVVQSGSSSYEHYLCPDEGKIMQGKGTAFRGGRWQPSGDFWIVQPKGNVELRLSDILVYLRGRFPGGFNVGWTCCRSPLGSRSLGKVEFANGNRYVETRIADDETNALGTKGAQTINGSVGGYLTIYNAGEALASQWAAWVGATNNAPEGGQVKGGQGTVKMDLSSLKAFDRGVFGPAALGEAAPIPPGDVQNGGFRM